MDKKLIGVDLGGTTIKFAILTQDGEVQQKWSIKTNILDEGSHIVPDIIESINHHLNLYEMKPEQFIGIGMGTPGTVDVEKGTVIGAYNLNWKTLQNVKEEVEKGTGIAFALDNDANVAALGEQWKGAGENAADVAFITLGTGVGGGVIMGGRPLIGANGAGGEIGHICVNYFEEKCCGCGKKGCLEQYASATGIARIAREHLAADTKDSILRTYDLDKIDAKIVFDALKEGDQLAVDVVEEFGEYLAKGLADVAVVVDPSLFVIGGGVSKAGEILLTYIEKYYRKRAFFANKDTQFAIASLGNDAGICGAAKLILDSQV